MRVSLILVLVLLFVTTAPISIACAEEAKVVAFVNASVVPMDTERVVPGQTVVVDGGKIVAIGAAAEVRVPAGALKVDATGRYLMPALYDMHVHLLGESWNLALPPELRMERKDIPFERFVFPFVAMGVTTVQDLMATAENLDLRNRIARSEALGPRIISAKMIDGPTKAWPPPLSTWIANAAEARAAVLRAKADGYDKIKVYSFLSKEAYDAIAATAKDQKMEFSGHVPMALTVEYVIEAGQRMIAHTEEIAKHTAAYDDAHVAYYADLLAKRRTWVIPTLTTTRSLLKFFDDADGIYRRPGAEHFNHPMQRGVWKFLIDNLYRPIPPEARQKLRDAFFKFQVPLTRALHDKGARLIAGTDSFMIGLYPGVSLHDELKEYVDIGFTPYQALRTATVNAAQYLGESDRAGTIVLGKQTDLLLVDGNPLENISAASKISGVLMRGRWLPAAEIDKRMKEIATAQ